MNNVNILEILQNESSDQTNKGKIRQEISNLRNQLDAVRRKRKSIEYQYMVIEDELTDQINNKMNKLHKLEDTNIEIGKVKIHVAKEDNNSDLYEQLISFIEHNLVAKSILEQIIKLDEEITIDMNLSFEYRHILTDNKPDDVRVTILSINILYHHLRIKIIIEESEHNSVAIFLQNDIEFMPKHHMVFPKRQIGQYNTTYKRRYDNIVVRKVTNMINHYKTIIIQRYINYIKHYI